MLDARNTLLKADSSGKPLGTARIQDREKKRRTFAIKINLILIGAGQKVFSIDETRKEDVIKTFALI
ncbi:hypothetical protein ACPJHQ_16460 [Rossellomorea sp. H39__3]